MKERQGEREIDWGRECERKREWKKEREWKKKWMKESESERKRDCKKRRTNCERKGYIKKIKKRERQYRDRAVLNNI